MSRSLTFMDSVGRLTREFICQHIQVGICFEIYKFKSLQQMFCYETLLHFMLTKTNDFSKYQYFLIYFTCEIIVLFCFVGIL